MSSPLPGFALALAASYLTGSFPTAYLVVKRLRGTDVRRVGSGNAGATNVARVAGAPAGLVVFLIDAAKGWAAVQVIAPWLVPSLTEAARLDCGVMAVLGHTCSVFLGFRGGKGVATTIGVLLGTMPGVAAACLTVWAGVFLLSRYVSAASIAAAATLPVAQMAMGAAPPETLLGLSLALLIILRHRDNLQRLRRGTEPRVGRARQG